MEQFEIAIILIVLLTFFICVPVLCLKCQTINDKYNYYKTRNINNNNTEIQTLII